MPKVTRSSGNRLKHGNALPKDCVWNDTSCFLEEEKGVLWAQWLFWGKGWLPQKQQWELLSPSMHQFTEVESWLLEFVGLILLFEFPQGPKSKLGTAFKSPEPAADPPGGCSGVWSNLTPATMGRCQHAAGAVTLWLGLSQHLRWSAVTHRKAPMGNSNSPITTNEPEFMHFSG